MDINTENWNKIHFVVYLFICIGKSDYNLVDDEIQEIFDKLEAENIKEEDYIAIYKSALKVHNKQTDSEVIDFIQDNHEKYCKDEEEKKKIIKDLEDIMEADGVIKDVEMIMYRFIKKTLLPS